MKQILLKYSLIGPIKKSLSNLVLIVFISAFSLSGCDQFNLFSTHNKSSSEPKKLSKRSKRSLPIVLLEQVQNRNLSYSSLITGTLQAKRSVKIYNQIKGLLIRLPFYEGDIVKKNQTIALLDKTMVQLELNKATVKEKQSSLNLNRIKKLVPKNLISKDELSQAKTLLALAVQETKKQSTALSYTKIQAPFKGIISQRLNEPGDVLSEHSHILSLIDNSQLIVKFPLSELLIPDITIGDNIDIQIDALGRQIFKAQIIRKYPTIDIASRQGVIEAILLSPPKAAMPGQLCKIHFISQAKMYLSIALSAIRHDQHSAYVFLYNDETKSVTKKNIIIGRTIDNYVEVTQGLKQGDKIVTKGQYGLKSGSKVLIKKVT